MRTERRSYRNQREERRVQKSKYSTEQCSTPLKGWLAYSAARVEMHQLAHSQCFWTAAPRQFIMMLPDVHTSTTE